MTVNVELLDRTLAHIEAHEDQWEQRSYRCESGMCFAGWTAVLAGGQWAEPESRFSALLVAEDGDDDRLDGLVHAHDRAQRVLGIDDIDAEELFAGRNTLNDLRRIVADLKASAQ